MKSILAISISDLHLHKWKNYNTDQSRLELYSSVLFPALEKIDNRCPILFSGDLFHEPHNIDPEVLKEFTKIYNKFIRSKRTFVCIAGNHDQKSLSNYKSYDSVVSYPKIIHDLIREPNFRYIGDYGEYLLESYCIKGINYVDDAQSFEKILNNIIPDKKTILLTHQNFPDSKDPSGYRVTSQVGAKSFTKLRKFGLVLNGHIHKYHKHEMNIYTVGATHQQRISDTKCKMGGLIIYNDLKVSRFELPMPKFLNESDGYNFYMDSEKELDANLNSPQVEGLIFSNTSKPTILAKKYLKAKGIKSKAKTHILLKYLRK